MTDFAARNCRSGPILSMRGNPVLSAVDPKANSYQIKCNGGAAEIAAYTPAIQSSAITPQRAEAVQARAGKGFQISTPEKE